MIGYSREEFVNQKSWLDITPPGYETIDKENMDHLLKNGFHHPFEKKYLHKDGTAVDVIVGSTAFEETNNRRGITFILNISDRKQSENALKESEERFRNIADNVPAFMFLVGKNAEVEYMNQTWLDFTGLSFQDAAGHGWTSIIHPDELDHVLKVYQDAFTRRKSYELEVRQIDKNGNYRWTQWKGVPRYVGDDFVGMMGIGYDITEKKNAEESLLYQKQILETVTANTDMALFLMDDKQYCVYMNDRAEQMTGFKLEELKGKQLHYYIHHKHPDGSYFPLEECPIDQALPSQKRMKGEETFIHKDGSFYPVAFTASPIVIDNVPVGTVIEIRETSEEKRRINELRESENRFRSLAEDAPAFIFLANADAQIEYVNSTWSNFCGLSKEDALGQGWAKVTHPEDVQRSFDIYNKAFETRSAYQYEMQQQGADGKFHWILWRGIPRYLPDGEFLGVLGFGFDITDRKESEAALKASEDLFRSFSNNINSLAWIADPTGWIYWYNKRWYEYTGTTLQEMQGWGWQKVHHPDHVNRIIEFCKEAWKKPEAFELTFPLRNASGEYRWFLTRAVPVLDQNGDIIRWIGTNTDIHEQKLLSERLEELVDERTEELRRSNEDLQQFAHVASHDLKEPIRKIRTYSNRIQEEFLPVLPEKAVNYLSKIQKGAERMFDMVDGVLLYSSVESIQHTTEKVNLNETLKNICVDLEVVIGNKNAQISIDQLPTVTGVPILLYQLFYNLLNNSLKFSKKDTIPFVKVSAGPIDMDLVKRFNISKPQKFIQIVFSDNGIGFDQNNAEKIFQTFSRLNSKDKFEGTGLGLALCRKIVERHNGFIYADGVEGIGATFKVILPK